MLNFELLDKPSGWLSLFDSGFARFAFFAGKSGNLQRLGYFQ